MNSAALGLDVFGHWNGFDTVRIPLRVYYKGTGFMAFAQYGVATHDDMFLHKCFRRPRLNAGMDLQRLAIGGWAHEFGMNFQQRRADDAGCLFEFAPGRDTAFHKEVQRSRIHPFGKIGKKNDAGRIAVAKLHLDIEHGGFAHSSLSAGDHALRAGGRFGLYLES